VKGITRQKGGSADGTIAESTRARRMVVKVYGVWVDCMCTIYMHVRRLRNPDDRMVIQQKEIYMRMGV